MMESWQVEIPTIMTLLLEHLRNPVVHLLIVPLTVPHAHFALDSSSHALGGGTELFGGILRGTFSAEEEVCSSKSESSDSSEVNWGVGLA